jgi:DNA-binding winged helix-turn-helix (wHTH) protein/tetratricopeptide (TPR) repeat protein
MLNKARQLYEFGPFQIDPDHRQLLRENQPVPLQPKAFDILLALVENSGNVVSKDDLLKRVWPDTFVEEANLSQHIFVLRKTLGDTVEDKRYIVTVPGRGYQLALAVRAIIADEEKGGAESNDEEIVVASRSSATLVIERGKSRDLRLWIATGAMLAAIAVAAGLYWRSVRKPLAFEKRDWIVVADFDNLTSDPVFERSLQTALVVGIQQSQYVNVLPAARIQEALRRMRKESGAKLDETVASDLAVREGAKAVLACSIAEVGGAYSLTARLVEPRSGATVLTESSLARDKSQVLPALDSLAKSIRQKLGESLSAIKQQGLPLPKATTSSLEALTTFADGQRLAQTNRQAAIELVEQAVAKDPDFAMAHAYLGARYYAGNDTTRGEQHFIIAMKLLDRLTLREQLGIRAQVEDFRGHREQAVQYYEAYLAQYPDDYPVRFRLGWVYMASLRQYDKAIPQFEKVLTVNPLHDASYINLATCYKGLGQTQRALAYYEKAFQINPADVTENYVNQEYGALLLTLGDSTKAAQVFQQMVGQSSDFKKGQGYRSLGMLEIYQGKFTDGTADLKHAILVHKAANMDESEFRDHLLLASAYRVEDSRADFLSELETAKSLLTHGHLGPVWISFVAKAYARLGKTAVATKLLNDMISQAQDPTAIAGVDRNNTIDQAVISIVRGELALKAGKSAEAIEAFQVADKLNPRSLAAESLANAYRVSGKPEDAARIYEDALSQGKFPLLSEGQEYCIMAHYELGKIYQELGENAKARAAYGEFLTLWKNADLDIPSVKQARSEYAKLQ